MSFSLFLRGLRGVLLVFSLLAAREAGAQGFSPLGPVEGASSPVTASLVTEETAAQAGHPFTVGLRFKIAPHWHTYWRYAGDFGLPTKIEWTLPPGWKAGEIQWPVPTVTRDEGDILSYTYSDEVLHLVTITPPAEYTGTEVTLKATAKWLMCAKECVPGKAALELTLPMVGSATAVEKGPEAPLFAKYRTQLPQAGPPPFSTAWAREEKGLVLKLGAGAPGGVEFYPIPPDDLAVGHPRAAVAQAQGGLAIQVPIESLPPSLPQLDGLLVDRSNPAAPKSWLLGPVAAQFSGASELSALTPHPAVSSLWEFLLLGFLGGLILNGMPCVLPVISLKILGFVHQAGKDRARIFRLGLAFTAGVFAWFLGLALALIAFQAAGSEVNWAFQFGNPWFVLGMFAVVLIFGLNLLGAFEWALPAGASGRIDRVINHDGYAGAFFHGVFATLLGSACTAPLLGPAVGFAVSQPPLVILAMFTAIAAGMALPYFLLTSNPGWLRLLPRPGLWMVRVKQGMGALMLLTALWLGWVFWQQQTKTIAPFAPQLARALASGRPVFVDFTADWCVNCKVNERLVLDSAPVQAALREHGVTLLKADWTRQDAEITALLKKFGRAGVPTYVVYAAGAPEKAEVLPELLTKELVIQALERAKK